MVAPIDPEIRAAVERLVRTTGHSLRAISLIAGLPPTTIRNWNRQEGWRPVRIQKRNDDPTLRRLAALERLSAARRGKPAGRAAPALPDPAPAGPDPVPAAEADLPGLRAALRTHVGRQIAAFDAALRGEGAAVIDSARVLRDLGGLKRLLDDLEGEGGDGGHDAAGAPGRPLDLPALRADLAERYARLLGGRPDAGVPGEPAGAPPPGAVA